MSRFREVVQAIRGPLEFACLHAVASLERAPELRATLIDAFRKASVLAIPSRARRRFEVAVHYVETGPWPPEAGARALRELDPLFQADFPEQVLKQSTDKVPGIGPKLAQALARKEIFTVEDLLLFLPRAYEDRRNLLSIAELRVGHAACFEGTVTRADVVPSRRGRRFFQAVVSDGTASVQIKWFRGIPHFQERVRPGIRLLVAGDVRRYRYALELQHPEVEVLREDAPIETLPRIIPRYSTVEGIPPRSVRRIIESALDYAADLVEDYLPRGMIQQLGLPPLGESIRQVHVPAVKLDPTELSERRTPYHLRLVCEELFLLQAGLEMRHRVQAERATRPLAVAHPEVRSALAQLPFELTRDQKRVWSTISADLSKPHPMRRLLVGDVGTGKTVLAWLAAVAAHASGGLAALLAPTEILAEQHLATFRGLGEPLGLRTALLSGSTGVRERRQLQNSLARGEIAVVVGTHALLGHSVDLPGLRLVVIDEQHRFGVEQRRGLGLKGEQPHRLVMTATPIPRTLALTLFGDLDHSFLRERPEGRPPVETRVVPRSAGPRVLAEIRSRLARGDQVFVVYPLVEESEQQDLRDATRGFDRLQKALPEVRMALVHGRVDAAERTQRMRQFSKGEIQLLVSTTVIEVGVDVPGASLLVVEHADRFGLAQLHQLRGRVGRGVRRGLAILIAEPRTEEASRRLAVLEACDSGFDIADHDLRIRGAGEWLGSRQAGHLPELRLADLVRHGELIPVAREAAQRLLQRDPELRGHPILRSGVERRWRHRLDLAGVA